MIEGNGPFHVFNLRMVGDLRRNIPLLPSKLKLSVIQDIFQMKSLLVNKILESIESYQIKPQKK